MESEKYAVVKVTVNLAERTVACDPDPVRCYWVAGPANIRWTFPDLPPTIDAVIIEWQKTNNPKYKDKPMFHGHGVAHSNRQSRLCDIVTFGNIKEKGKFKYAVRCLDSNGEVVAEKDPEGENDDVPQP